MLRNKMWVGLLVLLMTSISCSRSVDKTSHITLDLSSLKGFEKSNSSLSTGKVGLIVINVRGPGMPIKSLKWDAFDACGPDCTTEPTPPTSFTMSVPSGDSRLVQVMIVSFFDDESLEFSYGDAVANLSPGDQSVSVAVASVGGSSGQEANAQGRYVRSDGSAYTGPLIMTYQPPVADRPPMEMFRQEMYSGWFNAFLLSDIDFAYVMKDTGEFLFGGPINASSSALAAGASVAHFSKPTSYWRDSDGSTGQEPARRLIMGFWKGGAADASGSVCHDPTPFQFDHNYLDAATTDYLDWPADFTITSAGSCTVTSPLVSTTQMQVPGGALDHGGDSALFHGPFMNQKSSSGDYYDLLMVNYSAGELTLSWKYLPGVFSGVGAIDGVDVLVSSTSGDMDLMRGMDGVDCSSLITQQGFRVEASLSTQESYTMSGLTDSDLYGMKAVLCPRRGGTYMRAVAETHCLDCHLGGGDMSPATKFVVTQGPGAYVNQSACVPVFVEAQDDSGNMGSLPAYPYGITLSSGDASGSFYDDGACTYPVNSMQTDWGRTELYYKTNGTANNTTFEFTVAADPSETKQLTPATSAFSIAANSHSQWGIVGGALDLAWTRCERYFIQAQDSAGQPATASANFSFSTLGGTNGGVYDSWDCSTAIASNLTFWSGQTQNPVFFMGASSGSGGFSFAEGTYGGGSISLTLNEPGAPVSVTLAGTDSPYFCEKYQVEAVDQYWDRSPVSSQTVVQFSFSTNTGGGKFYSDSSCTNLVSAATIPVSTYSTDIYFGFTGSGSSDLYIYDAGGNLSGESRYLSY